MTWDKQTQATLNGWFGMQEQMLKSWWDTIINSSANGHASATPHSPWDFWLSQGLSQWQSLYPENAAAASQPMADVFKNAAAQFLSGQSQTEQLMRMVTEAWQALLVNTNSPAEWQAALTAYTAQLRQQMSAAMDGAKLMQNSSELWRLYAEQAQKFVQPWLTAWWQTPAFLGKFGSADQAEATNEFMQLYHAAFEQTFGRVLMAPSMGLLRGSNEKLNKSFALWLENQQLMLAYQLLIGEAWVDAFQALMQKLVTMAQKGETFTDHRHLLRIWVEVADEIFVALFHSDAYAKTQSAYVNSNMALRRQQRELLEGWLRSQDLPTRTDLEEAHHQIYQLRKEMKALKKSITEQGAQPTAVTPVATPTAATPVTKAKAPTKPKRTTKKETA